MKIRANENQESVNPTLGVVQNVDYSDMEICSACYGIRGRWRPAPLFEEMNRRADPQGYDQECDCDRTARLTAIGNTLQTWPGFDYNTAVEMCRCCGFELLKSGLKWSVWFCDECKWWVIRLNRFYGRCVIPIGRHSLMNGVGLRATEADDPMKVSEFLSKFKGFSISSERLSKWARLGLAENLAKLGFPGNKSVRIIDYLTAVSESRLDKQTVYENMQRFFAQQYEARGPENK